MKRLWMVALSVFALALVVPGCGAEDDDGGTENNGDTNNGDANNGDTNNGEQVDFDELDAQGRQTYMNEVVTPQMQEVFAGFDASYADNFQCATCHGADLGGGTFEMPGSISVLSAEELSTFTFEGEGRQEIANAMATQVLPAMADLLGEEPYNPETNTGTFGCAGCHMIQ